MKNVAISTTLASFLLLFFNHTSLRCAGPYQVQQDGVTVQVIKVYPHLKVFRIQIFNETPDTLEVPARVGLVGSIIASEEMLDNALRFTNGGRIVICSVVGMIIGMYGFIACATIFQDTRYGIPTPNTFAGWIGGPASFAVSTALLYKLFPYNSLEKIIVDYKARPKLTIYPDTEQGLSLLIDTAKFATAIDKKVILQLRDEKNGKVIRIPLDIEAAEKCENKLVKNYIVVAYDNLK